MHSPIKLPLFYKEVITSWHMCQNTSNAADIRKEIILGNKYIQYFKHWENSNINFIDDLVDKNF